MYPNMFENQEIKSCELAQGIRENVVLKGT